MSSRNGSSGKGGEEKSKTNGGSATRCVDVKSSKSKDGGSSLTQRSHKGSAADRKMMRAWETISENRSAAKRK